MNLITLINEEDERTSQEKKKSLRMWELLL